MSAERNYYEVLGIDPSASQDAVRRAYRAMARRYHPDSRSEASATTIFHEVQIAYSVLSDSDRRRAYDAHLAKSQRDDGAVLTWNVQVSQSQLYLGYEEQLVYVLVDVQPLARAEGKRLPLNLCLVVDRSTSMQGKRLEHVKAAVYQVIDDLDARDTLSIVSFSDRAEIIVPSAAVRERAKLKSVIGTMQAGGGTEIRRGLQAGLSEIAVRHSGQVSSHLILLTDGHTYGDEEGCLAVAENAGSDRTAITTLGIGADWNESLLDEIARRSAGESVYISSPDQVGVVLQQRVRDAGRLFAQGLRLMVRRAEQVRLERAYLTSPVLRELEERGGSLSLGNLEGNHPVTAVIELLVIGKPSAGESRLVQLELLANVPGAKQKDVRLQSDLSFEFTLVDHSASSAPSAIVEALSRITLYEMQQRAWAVLEEGDAESAHQQLELVAIRLLGMGETQLAETAMLEAGRIAEGGGATARGRKEIRYGTRSLGVAGWERNDD
ncbi:MAG: VWA domain-containing protein [Chloroflexi bacterium]|nr:VWA domain-containing protein [Chloroflexota bacterium]